MKTTLKLTAAAMLTTGCLFMNSGAMADPCPSSQHWGEFIAAGSCTDVDKLYTYGASDFGLFPLTDLDLEITSFDLGGTEIHNFSINPGGATGVLLAGTYTLSYTIEILDPEKFFGSVSIDSDVPSEAPDVTVEKIVDNDADTTNGNLGTLTSLAGAPDSLSVTAFTYQKFWIYETVTVGANGAVNSFTDTYVQRDRAFPEPATLALLGLGLAGLGFSRRKAR